MYILDSAQNTIHDSYSIQRYRILEKEDAILIVGFVDLTSSPVTLGKYASKSEAKAVLLNLFAALGNGKNKFEMPASVLFYYDDRVRDARTKRKGSS